MGRSKTVESGAPAVFYLGKAHREALDYFREEHGFKNTSEAIRAILDLVSVANDSAKEKPNQG